MASKFDTMRAAAALFALSALTSPALAYPKMNHVYPSNAYGAEGVASAVTSGTSYVSPGTETEGDYGFASSTSIYSETYATTMSATYPTSTNSYTDDSSVYTTSTGTYTDLIPSFTESYTTSIPIETPIDLSTSYTETALYSETGVSTYGSVPPTFTSDFLPTSTGGFEFSISTGGFEFPTSTGTYSTVYPTETSTCNDVTELDPRCAVLFPFVGQNDLAAVCELFLQGPGGCDCGSVSTTYGGYYPTTTAPFPYGNSTATGAVIGTVSPTTTFELGGVTTTFSTAYTSVTPIPTGSSSVTFDDLFSTDSYILSDTETYSASAYASSTYTSSSYVTSAYSATSATYTESYTTDSYASQPTATGYTEDYTYSGTHMKRN